MFTVQEGQVGLELVHQGQEGQDLQVQGIALEGLSFLCLNSSKILTYLICINSAYIKYIPLLFC